MDRSSPLSQVDDSANQSSSRVRSKFSLAALCSPTNSPTVAPAPSDGDASFGRSNGARRKSTSRREEPSASGEQFTFNEAVPDTPPTKADEPMTDGAAPEAAEQADDEEAEGVAEGGDDGDEGDDDDDDDDDDDEEDDDEDEDEDDDEDDEDGDEEGKEDGGAPIEGAESGKDADGDAQMEGAEGGTAGASTSADKATNKLEVKRKVKRKQREPSVDVSLPKGPPTLPTVRLNLSISGDSYTFNVPELLHSELKEKQHPWADWYESQQNAVAEKATEEIQAPAPPIPGGLGDLGPYAHLLNKYPVEGPGAAPGTKQRKKRKRREAEEYDVNDPFVDDSELQIDEPTHSAKPLSKGFYVADGDVQLELLAKTKRGKAPSGTSTPVTGSSRPGAGMVVAPPSYLIAGTQLEVANMMLYLRAKDKGLSVNPSMPPEELPEDAIGLLGSELLNGGTRDSPIEIKDVDAANNSNKKKTYPMKPVDRRLAAELQYLKKLVAAESFQVKSRFPPNLRPPLRKAAKLAVELGEYKENFFNYLPNIFPYNRFTMSKLTKRDFYEEHASMIRSKQDELLDDLRQCVEEALPTHRSEYESLAQQGTVEGSAAPQNGTGDEEVADAGAEGEEEGATAANGAAKDKGADAPLLKKWKWTERMREDVFQYIILENGLTELRAEKNKLEGSTEPLSELIQRKGAYKRINDLWPAEEGWTTTTGISKEFSIQKKKHERHNNALAEQQQQQQQQQT